jgi:ABC-2 type transport system permease protein
VGGFFWVAGAVAGRQIYKYFTNPAFLAPAFFPIFFFVAFAGGLTRVGDVPGFDFFGLIGLAVLVNVAATLFGAGVAMLMRTQQAGPVIRTPIFMVLFLASVFVPLNLLQGWIETIARLNPFTTILDAARGFLAGEPTSSLPAYAIGFALVLAFALWAHFGLRRAEKAG